MDVSSAGIFGGNKVVTLKAGASESETNPMFFDVSGTASCVVQSTGTTTIQAGITSGWYSFNLFLNIILFILFLNIIVFILFCNLILFMFVIFN